MTLSFGSNGILCLLGILPAINEQSGKETRGMHTVRISSAQAQDPLLYQT